jgi:hypothetical protein
MATSLKDPGGVAVDASYIYFAEQGTSGAPNFRHDGLISRVPVGGGAKAALATGEYHPFGVTIDATNIYWTSKDDNAGSVGSIRSMPLGGGAVTTLSASFTSEDNPHFVAVDASNVYWTTATTVKKVPIGGGAATTLASGVNNAYGIALDATTVYFTEYAGNLVSSVPKAGGAKTVIASGLNGPYGVAVSGTTIFWAELLGGKLMKQSLLGGAATQLGDGAPALLALNATNVYWTNYQAATGRVKRVPQAGGAQVLYTKTADRPFGLALDSTYMYFGELGGSVGNGTIQRGVQ